VAEHEKYKSRHSILQSWLVATKGLIYTIRHERNVGLVCFFIVLAVFISAFLRISAIEWVIVVLCCGIVLTCELLNTAIEAVTDLACNQEIHPLAKIAKDTGSAATLAASVTSLIVAAIIFLPKLFH